jgi:hypothetical protein
VFFPTFVYIVSRLPRLRNDHCWMSSFLYFSIFPFFLSFLFVFSFTFCFFPSSLRYLETSLEQVVATARAAFDKAQRDLERAHARLVEVSSQLADLQGKPVAIPSLVTAAAPGGAVAGAVVAGSSAQVAGGMPVPVMAAVPAGTASATWPVDAGASENAIDDSRLKTVYECRWETCMQTYENRFAL